MRTGRDTSRRHGPRGLIIEMLTAAVDDVQRPETCAARRGDPGVHANHRDAESARRWLLGLHDEDETPIISALDVCEALGFDYDAIRAQLLSTGALRWRPRPERQRRASSGFTRVAS